MRKIKSAIKHSVSTSSYRVGIFLAILFLLSFFSKIKIPNILGISSVQIATTILSVIIGSLASVLGIIIAVILVAFEILRKSYNIYAFKTFFKDEKLKELIILYIFTIIASLITLSTLSVPLNSRSINLIYTSLFLFIISLVILFPYSRIIISSTKSKEKIKEIVDQIDYSTIHSLNYLRPSIPPSVYISQMEENPLFILSEVGIRTLKDDDRLTPKLILVECGNKLLKMLGDFPDSKRGVINSFLIVFRNISRQAINLHQEGTLITVLDVIETLHNFCAENKTPWHELIELNQFISDFLQETLIAGLDEITSRGLYMIERIMKKHVEKNIPKEEEIWILHFHQNKNNKIKHDAKKDLQWEHVSNEYIRILSNITEKAIRLHKGETVRTGMHALSSVVSEVLNMQLGDLQKHFIIRWCCYYMKDLTIKSVEENLYTRVLAINPFSYLGIDRALDQKKEFSKEPLIRFCETLILLNKRNALDTFVLNELGAIGRSCVHKLDEHSLYKEALIFIVKTFNKLREDVEKEINNSNIKRIYIELRDQVFSLKRWMKDYNKKDEEIEILIENTLSSFDYYEELKNELEKGIIKWPTLKDNNQ